MTKQARTRWMTLRLHPSQNPLLTLAVILAVLAAWVCAPAGAQPTNDQPKSDPAAIPEMNVGAKDYPDADAIFLRREQTWTLDKDGTLRRRDHQWVKLLDTRAIGPFADPRIDYCVGQDEMTIHTARTILPNGTIMPVPEYAFNQAGPDDVAGWAQYVGWVQTVICFAGIENGCVLELDYEIVSKPGMYSWAEADLRLNEDYPTVLRVVSVTIPDGAPLHYKLEGISPAKKPATKTTPGGGTTYRWTFDKLAAAPGEPQSLPWPKRCGRLRFTTCPNAEAWTAVFAQTVEQAAQPTDAIKKFAEAAIEKEPNAVEQLRKVTKKLSDSFNFIGSWKAMHPPACRPAGDVLNANYGNPLESAALLAAALNSLGIKSSVEIAVNAESWDATVPTESAFAGVTILVESPDGPIRVHPQHGILKNPGKWGRRWVLAKDASGKLLSTYLASRGEEGASRLVIGGKITIGADGQVAGDLRIRLTGGFYDPENLESSSQQAAFIRSLVGRVVQDADVSSHAITTLSPETLQATARIASKGELKAVGKSRILRLGDGPAFLGDFPLPLGRSYRSTDVDVGGTIEEDIDLIVELPKDWVPEALPPAIARTQGDWGVIERTVVVDGTTLRIRRTVTIAEKLIPAENFSEVRERINHLRGKADGMLVVGPAAKPTE